MARRTPPIPVQVVDGDIPSLAYHRKRLIDFDTDSDVLEEQHKTWLRSALTQAKGNSAYYVYLFGYGSRLGGSAINKALSQRRLNSVLKFMQTIDPRTMMNIDLWEAEGSSMSLGDANDDSPHYRAVEVHIFIGRRPDDDIVPPHTRPIRHDKPPLPGGPRYTDWAVASPGGVFVAEVFGGGFNVFFIKNNKTGEEHGYLQPVLGIGASVSISGLKLVWRIIQQIFTGVQYSKPDYVNVTSSIPITWEELGDSLVRVSSIGGGVIKGYTKAIVTFTAANVYQYSEQGNPVRKEWKPPLFQFDASGKNWQLGLNGSVVVGPIHKVD